MPIAMSVSLSVGSSPDPKLQARAANASGKIKNAIVRSVLENDETYERWVDIVLSRIDIKSE